MSDRTVRRLVKLLAKLNAEQVKIAQRRAEIAAEIADVENELWHAQHPEAG